jgi:hypothetical protein
MDKIREYAAVGAFLGGALGLFVVAMGWMFQLRFSYLVPLLIGLFLPPAGYFLWPYRK